MRCRAPSIRRASSGSLANMSGTAAMAAFLIQQQQQELIPEDALELLEAVSFACLLAHRAEEIEAALVDDPVRHLA